MKKPKHRKMVRVAKAKPRGPVRGRPSQPASRGQARPVAAVGRSAARPTAAPAESPPAANVGPARGITWPGRPDEVEPHRLGPDLGGGEPAPASTADDGVWRPTATAFSKMPQPLTAADAVRIRAVRAAVAPSWRPGWPDLPPHGANWPDLALPAMPKATPELPRGD